MESRETREILARLDNKDHREFVVLLDLKAFQAKKVRLVLKDPRVTRVIPDILVFKVSQALLDLKVLLELRVQLELLDLKVLLDPRDHLVSLVKMDPLDLLDLLV